MKTTRGKRIYQVFLHVMLIALGVEVYVLSAQNRNLKATDEALPGNLRAGDYFSLAGLNAIQTKKGLMSEKDLLVFVFTTNCPFCRETVPEWGRLYDVLASDQMSIVGISLSSETDTEQFIKSHSIEYDIFTPMNLKDFKTQNKLSSVPQTILRSSEGTIAEIWPGRISEKEYSEVVAASFRKENTPQTKGDAQ